MSFPNYLQWSPNSQFVQEAVKLVGETELVYNTVSWASVIVFVAGVLNSLTVEVWEKNSRSAFLKLILPIDISSTSCKIGLRWVP